jgi:hypothetical protein
VADVTTNLVYHVEYAGQRTRDFKVSVFEHPRLERADANLAYPDYTAQPPKRIENTRRLTAVEGTRLDLELQLNKPVASARLVSKDGNRTAIAFQVQTNRAAATLKQFLLETNKTYELHLVDLEGRTNKVPAQFVFEVLKNRTPEMHLASPRGDIRPSPLEEISFEGTVWDDFGVPAYGLAYTVAGQETKFVELGRSVPAKEKRPFKYLLRLEELGLRPDQLVSWFIWADDLGPDGQVRRTTGDLFFGEVRPFEEVFTEGQGNEGQSEQGQSGSRSGQNQTERLTELQKQIISATWKLQRDHASSNRAPTKADGNTSTEEPAEGAARLVDASRPMHGQIPMLLRVKSEIRNPKSETNSKSEVQRLETPTLATRPYPHGTDSVRGRAVPAPKWTRTSGLKVFGQVTPTDSDTKAGRSSSRPTNRALAISGQAPKYADDVNVVRDSETQALEQAKTALARQQDPRTAALWSAAIKDLENAVARLKEATGSPAALAKALAEEQTAYQALLKLQEHEFQVSRSRNRSQSGGGRSQQMQRQLDQMDLTQSENRYETQRQAQRPQPSERREDLQVMNRLQELARRQQDLNDRLKELQTALQEARTEREREEIRRRLKRLEEEEQQMIADVDEVRQRMDRPENQSRMSEERKQLEQTREDVQKAAEAAAQGSASQALASGTRAQRQLQQLREQMRKENSSQFADDLRQMRSESRELAQQQEDLLKKMEAEAGQEHKTLADTGSRQEMLQQLARQKELTTNLVERATQISQQAENAEPLLSRQLEDTVRKFTQDTAKAVQETQDQLFNRRLVTANLLERLKDTAEPDGAKLQDITSEMLRLDVLPQARETALAARAGIAQLKQGVERAAESVLGDDTDALRLAQQELEQLAQQLQREMAQADTNSTRTNERSAFAGQSGTNGTLNSRNASNSRSAQGQRQNSGQRGAQTAQNGSQNQQENAQSESEPAQSAQASSASQGQPGAESQAQEGQPPGEQAGQQSGPQGGGRNGPANAQGGARNGERAGGERQTAQANQDGRANRDGARRGGSLNGGYQNSAAGGYDGGDIGGSLNRAFDRVLDDGSIFSGPITGQDFLPWSDRLRDVEEMLDQPQLRNDVAAARERARLLRREFQRDRKKPDWAVVQLQIMKPLLEVRDRIADELARRESREALVPLDRDPVPSRYSDLVRRYYEELGKEK